MQKYLAYIYKEREFDAEEIEAKLFSKLSSNLREELILYSNGPILN